MFDGQHVHEERTLGISVTSQRVCIRSSAHTIAWPMDPAIDTDDDGHTHACGELHRRLLRGGFFVHDVVLNPHEPSLRRLPDDPTQWFDTDGDGYGDNASGTNSDRFPNNANQWSDTDGDGYGDNSGHYLGDGCPDTPGTSSWPVYGCPDSDDDSVPEVCEYYDGCVRLQLVWVGDKLDYALTRGVDSCPSHYGSILPYDVRLSRFGRRRLGRLVVQFRSWRERCVPGCTRRRRLTGLLLLQRIRSSNIGRRRRNHRLRWPLCRPDSASDHGQIVSDGRSGSSTVKI